MTTIEDDFHGSDALISDNSEEGSWSSGSQTSSEENLSWISWWCAHQGHEFFAEVPEEFIQDDFNMTGLPTVIDYYQACKDLILDLEPEDEEEEYVAADQQTIESNAEILYALVHQRYICSRNGLITMAEKYEAGHFGVCPRVHCAKTAVLPVGLSDRYTESNVKLYCPSCLDIYNPPNSRFYEVDGAYFGTTFPHLFFMTFPELLPHTNANKATPAYVPKIYGFKVSQHAVSGPKMSWLRQYIHHGRRESSIAEILDSGSKVMHFPGGITVDLTQPTPPSASPTAKSATPPPDAQSGQQDTLAMEKEIVAVEARP